MRKVLASVVIAIFSLCVGAGRDELTPQEIIERFASKEAEFKEV